MEMLLENLSSYNLLNYLIPGVVICYLNKYTTGINFLVGNAIENLIIAFFVGMIASRFGSLLLEPFLMKIKFITYAKYVEFLEVSKNDPMLDILTEKNNTYRTFSGGFLVVVLLNAYNYLKVKCDLPNISPFILLVILLIGFLLSYRKQTAYIRKRVNKYLEKTKKNDVSE